MLELPPRRHLGTAVQASLDLSVLVAAFLAAYLLRFDFRIPQPEIRNIITQMPLVVLLQFVALTILGAPFIDLALHGPCARQGVPLRSVRKFGRCGFAATRLAETAPSLESAAIR